MEKTQPKIFHIHIDANRMTRDLYDFALENGFYDSNFNGHPDGYEHFEPKRHMTLKLKTKSEFDEKWNKLETFIDEDMLEGYIEGEYIPIDEFLPYKEYSDIDIPFSIQRRRLTGIGSRELFRQTEIHLTMEKDKSNSLLINKLLSSGLYGAYIPKERGVFLVLTIQGFIKDIVPLTKTLKEFIIESGGAHSCTIKEERAIEYKLFGVASNELPEIAEAINYSSDVSH